MLQRRLWALPVLLCMLWSVGLLVLGTPAAAQADVVAAQDDTESIGGTLKNSDDGEPVPGARISATRADGTVVGEATTAADGTWEIQLDGPGDYVAELDLTTLPEGVTVTNAERNPLTFSMRAGQSRTIIFPLGEAVAGESFGSKFVNSTRNGLQFGLVIAMTAIGLSLIFGTTGLVNFAHSELVTFGAVAAWFFNSPAHLGGKLHIIPAALIAVVLSGLLGAGLERGLWRPLRRRRTGLVQQLVISIGLALLLRNFMQVIFGGSAKPYVDYSIQTESISWIPFISVNGRDLAVLGISVVTLVGVALMLQYTRIGKAMRAVADNRDLAESSGIDVDRVILFVWILGAALAGLGGILAGLDESVTALIGFRLILLIFAGVVLGGLGTAYGALLGSLVVGLMTEWSTLWFPTELKTAWALGALIVILLVRPQGLLGQKERFG